MTKHQDLQKAIEAMNGTGSVFVPGDVEEMYDTIRNDGGNVLPTWEEAEGDLLESYHWNKAMPDRMTEMGWSVITDMIYEYESEQKKQKLLDNG